MQGREPSGSLRAAVVQAACSTAGRRGSATLLSCGAGVLGSAMVDSALCPCSTRLPWPGPVNGGQPHGPGV